MIETTAPVSAIAPALPNASIDMNKLFENDAAGLTGTEMLAGALLVEPITEPAVAVSDPETRAPRVGDVINREDLGGGWIAVTAPWLDAPVKVQGEAAASDKIDELMSLIPASAS